MKLRDQHPLQSRMAKKHLKKCSNQEVPSYTHQNAWDQKQETAHAGEDVEQEEHFFIAGDNENLSNHFGNQYGRFSENLD